MDIVSYIIQYEKPERVVPALLFHLHRDFIESHSKEAQKKYEDFRDGSHAYRAGA